MLKDLYFQLLSSSDKESYRSIVEGVRQKKREIVVPTKPSENVLEAVRNEHPELFYWDTSHYEYREQLDGVHIFVSYFYSRKQCIEIIDKSNEVAKLCATSNDEHTIRKVHNYIIKHITYDSKDTDAKYNHNLVGPVMLGRGVCEGIALFAKYLFDKLNIDNAVALGNLNGTGHMWNIVSINGKNYHVDITSDIGFTEPNWDKPSYAFYLLRDCDISKTHNISNSFNCKHKQDNLFFKNGKWFSSINSLLLYISTIKIDERLIYFKYDGAERPETVAQYVFSNLKPNGSRIGYKENAGVFYFFR